LVVEFMDEMLEATLKKVSKRFKYNGFRLRKSVTSALSRESEATIRNFPVSTP